MSPIMHIPSHLSHPYVPVSDAMDRHDYGVSKVRKLSSTGGGRAWSEDEEVYLLQTRLQKMPYKHIAAHLKKTELACRLHYHQLSHGSNRRKRTASVSSGSSAGHSPILPATLPAPIRECSPRETSPPGSSGSYGPELGSPHPVHLPSIMAGSSSSSPRLPAILPKPGAMVALPPAAIAASGPPPPMRYSTPAAEPASRGPSLAPANFPPHQPALRLDCSSLPPPAAHVDMQRLQAIYSAHRSSFWGPIAAEYGGGVSPIVLEQAWKAHIQSGGNHTPITPMTSPNDRDASIYEKQAQPSSLHHHQHQHGDRTRINAILGIDADPRSPEERELVRRLEEGRSIGVVASV
ncbi:hypothetical protein BX600DRAFT_86408 [Xylariales sp. PMI_506]|nr:hypothetical protein BX600DRAFT_86408 [Xylariales sp. PMI_506]